MKICIGDKIYDGKKVPVMVILTDDDKKNIASLASEATMYCEYPDGMSVKKVEEFMNQFNGE